MCARERELEKNLVLFWDLLKYKSVSEKKNFHAMTSGEVRSTSVFLIFVGKSVNDGKAKDSLAAPARDKKIEE